MEKYIKTDVLTRLNASSLELYEIIQELWSGYGQLSRYKVQGADINSLIVKSIDLSLGKEHPRGWNTSISHQRKIKSYAIESYWYKNWAGRCNEQCRVPKLYAAKELGNQQYIILEDLDESGFSKRIEVPDLEEIMNVLCWLASFHANYLNEFPHGLWDKGSYWQLDSRPEEWERMETGPLKKHAIQIAKILINSSYKTIIHGDAKLANFCFSMDSQRVAAVDFQYVGGGCGMVDLAYFLSSCPSESNWQSRESELLNHYFSELEKAIKQNGKEVEFDQLEQEWRSLYDVA